MKMISFSVLFFNMINYGVALGGSILCSAMVRLNAKAISEFDLQHWNSLSSRGLTNLKFHLLVGDFLDKYVPQITY